MNLSFPAVTIDNIRTALVTHKQTVAVAESVSSGLLQAALSSAQDASMFFEGGITAYNIRQKIRHLHINEEKAKECNCVSQATAIEMALGVCDLFKSDWGISVTGYSSPIKKSGFAIYAYAAIAKHGHAVKAARIELGNETNENAQLAYMMQVLEMFEEQLLLLQR